MVSTDSQTCTEAGQRSKSPLRSTSLVVVGSSITRIPLRRKWNNVAHVAVPIMIKVYHRGISFLTIASEWETSLIVPRSSLWCSESYLETRRKRRQTDSMKFRALICTSTIVCDMVRDITKILRESKAVRMQTKKASSFWSFNSPYEQIAVVQTAMDTSKGLTYPTAMVLNASDRFWSCSRKFRVSILRISDHFDSAIRCSENHVRKSPRALSHC